MIEPPVAFKDPHMTPLVRLERVSKHYRQGEILVKAVDDVSLVVWPGDFLVITGRSGAGKTTLLSLMGGLTRPTTGKILIEGRDLSGLADDDLSALRAEKLGFVFQFPSLIPTLTALENVVLPTLFAGRKPRSLQRGIELLRQVGLEDKLISYPAQLSGGQQRRVAVARALINQPALLLADEPTGDLDVETEHEIMALFRELNHEGLTIVLVTHNPELTAYGNRELRMDRGRLTEPTSQATIPQFHGSVQC